MKPGALLPCLSFLSLLAAVAALTLCACGASNKSTEPDWVAPPEEKVRPVRDTETLNATPQGPAEAAAASSASSAPLGVRHDLMLANGAHPARCACLSVEAGPAADPRFFWTGGPVDLGGDALAIAIGARGVDCPGGDPDEARRRPSISAIDQENNDIIVEVEDLPPGRPLASGAIIPRPGAGGALYVRPRAPGQAYAKGAPGGRCKVR